MAHPDRIKARALVLLMLGNTPRWVSAQLGIPRTTVRRWQPEARAWLRASLAALAGAGAGGDRRAGGLQQNGPKKGKQPKEEPMSTPEQQMAERGAQVRQAADAHAQAEQDIQAAYPVRTRPVRASKRLDDVRAHAEATATYLEGLQADLAALRAELIPTALAVDTAGPDTDSTEAQARRGILEREIRRIEAEIPLATRAAQSAAEHRDRLEEG